MSAAIAGLVRGGTALAAPASYSETFARAATSKGWGKAWFNQRQGLSWGIARKAGYVLLPEPQVGAGRHNPNPVLLLDHDAADGDVKARLRTRNRNARFGVIARAVGYGDYYAAYLEGSTVRISRFGLGREKELKKATITIKSDVAYWLRFQISGTDPVQMRAKVWPASRKEPSGWTLFASESLTDSPIARPGMTGFLFLHDDITKKAARVKVDNFSFASDQRRRNTSPEITFAFAGRIEPSGGAFRARVVAKTNVPATMAFELADNPKLTNPTTIAPNEVIARSQVSKAFLTGLAPSQTVYWRPVATSKSGRRFKGRIRALPTPPAAREEASFCFGSCTKLFATSTAFKRAADLKPFFFAQLGDLGYPESVLSGGGSMALTSGSFQDRWTRMLAPRSVTELHRTAAWIMLQDDHDYGRDNCWSETVRPFTVGAFDRLSGNLDERYFDVRYGDMHSFFVDTRLHADDPEAPDGPGHSLLGVAQKSWLKDAMQGSDAPLMVVFASQPFWGGGDGLFGWKQAFAEERTELLSFFRSLQTAETRVIICSGNSHAHYINRHSAPGEKDIIEFVSSGMDRREATGGRRLPDDGIIDPQRAAKSRDGFGYVRLRATGANPRVEMRCIDSSSGADIWPALTTDL